MPKRRRPKLGQHFLTDTRYCSRIIDALGLRSDELVLEIGPGHGAMTELLAARAQRVVAVEVDPGLADELRQKYEQESKVEIVHADVLSTDLGAICRRRDVKQCYVFGNLPYYITSPIIHHVLAFTGHVRAMGLLVQREVANRLVANPGTRDYGYLTVFTRLYSSPRVVLQIPPGAFTPPPKVQSALVCFEMRAPDGSAGLENKEEFLDFLKQSFAYKRKKLINCLSPLYPRQRIEEELKRLALPSGVRAEQLSLEQFIALFSRLR